MEFIGEARMSPDFSNGIMKVAIGSSLASFGSCLFTGINGATALIAAAIAIAATLVFGTFTNRTLVPKSDTVIADVTSSIDAVLHVENSSINHGVYIFTGQLKVSPDVAFMQLKEALQGFATPILQGTERNAIVLIAPIAVGAVNSGRAPAIVHVVLALLTLISTTWVGTNITGNLNSGFAYSVSLLTILGVHELGHYTAARMHGIDVTPPFFIPVPFGLGTFGAFIQLRAPAPDRKGLFDVAIAGPLAGFFLAFPILLIGLQSSTIVHSATPVTRIESLFWEGVPASGSLLLNAACQIAQPGILQFGDIIHLSPMALAGWIGIWVTALNLIPVGQLDGGHAAHGLLGGRFIRGLNRLTYMMMILGGLLYWPGLLTWALLIYFIAGQSVPPLNDISAVDTKRRVVGLFALAILICTFCPQWQ